MGKPDEERFISASTNLAEGCGYFPKVHNGEKEHILDIYGTDLCYWACREYNIKKVW